MKPSQALTSLVVAAAACTPPPPEAPTTRPEPAAATAPVAPPVQPAARAVEAESHDSLPEGWWLVTKNDTPEKADHAAFRFSDEGYLMVADGDHVDRRACAWKRVSNGWRCESPLPFTLVDSGSTAEMIFARGRFGLRLAEPSDAAALDARVRDLPDTADICGQAERCCHEALALLGETCDSDWQLAGKSSARTCAMSLQGLRTILAEKQIALPDSCRER